MPTDVRRSARGAPPLPTSTKPVPPASTASSSSLSSGRQDRVAKSSVVPKSATPHSRSSEEMSEPPRRSQRAHQPKDDEPPKKSNGVEDDAADEEEVTRCICGQQEYPGPPLSEAFDAAALESEDAGGLFISCDGCSVWQHGGCVGIVEESEVPDKYFCEECRPKLHTLHTDTRGYVPPHQHSHFLPTSALHCSVPSVVCCGDSSREGAVTESLTATSLTPSAARGLCELPDTRRRAHKPSPPLHTFHPTSSQWRAIMNQLYEQLLTEPNTDNDTRSTNLSTARPDERARLASMAIKRRQNASSPRRERVPTQVPAEDAAL